jgi:Mor family transcriptional regulator
MTRKRPDKLYAFLEALIEIGTRELANSPKLFEAATPEARATEQHELMHRIGQALCFRFARTILYVPANLEFHLGKRDKEIWDDYGKDGPNGARKYTQDRVVQLSEQYNLTVVQIYCIVKLMYKREVAALQGTLPGFDSEAAS